MKILLLIILLDSGAVTRIPFDDFGLCVAAKSEVKELMSPNSVKAACIIQSQPR